jgi:3-oxoacyl-[acyl-carrier-protein] synthase-3
LVATGTPDHNATPSTASLLQHKLNIPPGRCGAADLAAACTGFIYALSFGKALVSSGTVRHVLVVGGETLTRIVNCQDRETCVLFGDGAGAVVLGPAVCGPKKLQVGEVRLFSDGSGGEKLIMPAGGSRQPASAETVEQCGHYLHLDGQEIFRFAVNRMIEMIGDVLRRNQWKPTHLGLIVPHQANARMFQAVALRLNLPENLMYSNLSAVEISGFSVVRASLPAQARRTRRPAATKTKISPAHGIRTYPPGRRQLQGAV